MTVVAGLSFERKGKPGQHGVSVYSLTEYPGYALALLKKLCSLAGGESLIAAGFILSLQVVSIQCVHARALALGGGSGDTYMNCTLSFPLWVKSQAGQ